MKKRERVLNVGRERQSL